MGAALAEAKAAIASGDRGDGAVAVLDEAMVARGHNQVESTGDPTAHAVMVVLREAARRLGRTKLSGMIIFAAHEPCTMCVGALLESDVYGLVFALTDLEKGATGSGTGSTADALRRRVKVVSGIMQAEAADLTAAMPATRN